MSFTVRSTGNRAGAVVPQVYPVEAPGERRQRLLGFQRVELAPGESRTVTLTADPRLLARFDVGHRRRTAPAHARQRLRKFQGARRRDADGPHRSGSRPKRGARTQVRALLDFIQAGWIMKLNEARPCLASETLNGNADVTLTLRRFG